MRGCVTELGVEMDDSNKVVEKMRFFSFDQDMDVFRKVVDIILKNI